MQMIEGSLVAIQVFWITQDSKTFPIEAIAHLIIAIICKTMRLIAVIVLWKSTLVAISCCNELNFSNSKQSESEKKRYLITKQNKHVTDRTKKEVKIKKHYEWKNQIINMTYQKNYHILLHRLTHYNCVRKTNIFFDGT